jgi:hypothetical protein
MLASGRPGFAPAMKIIMIPLIRRKVNRSKLLPEHVMFVGSHLGKVRDMRSESNRKDVLFLSMYFHFGNTLRAMYQIIHEYMLSTL